jgi:hypothetical protein
MKYKDKISNFASFLNLKISVLIEKYYGNIFYFQNTPKSKTFNKILSLCYDYNKYKIYENEEDILFVKNKLSSLTHFKDKRTYYEYATDLILGWVLEDFIVDKIKTICKVKINSKDSNREFLNYGISTTSDLLLENNVNLEIMQNYSEFWKKYQVLHLRDNKYNNLKKEKSFLLGIDFHQNKIIFIDISTSNSTYINEHIAYGNKPAYEININNFYDIKELNNLIKKII